MTRARCSFVALLLTALLVVPAGPASAHDQLIGSDPEDGSTVGAPDSIELTFSGAIGDLGAQVAVTDAAGRSVVEGDPDVQGAVVEQDLVEDLAAGAYAVVWRVTSEDGHPISGEFAFTVEAGEDSATDEATSGASGTSEEATTDATPAATDGAATDGAATDGADVTADPAEAQGEAGLPVWAWVVMGLAAAGLLGLLARTWARGRE
jgi:copper resistance protein C